MSPRRRVTVVLLLAGNMLTPGLVRPDEIKTQMLVTSDLLAAFVVAYEDYKKEANSNGEALTLTELVSRHRAIGCKAVGDKIEVYFFPATSSVRGGGIRYLVDPETMRVVERTFDK